MLLSPNEQHEQTILVKDALVEKSMGCEHLDLCFPCFPRGNQPFNLLTTSRPLSGARNWASHSARPLRIRLRIGRTLVPGARSWVAFLFENSDMGAQNSIKLGAQMR